MANDTASKDRPWEDTLILAFRGIQWIRKIQQSTRPIKARLAQPPELMIKLNGNAEAAAGDVIASNSRRYFLFEFKSDASLLYTEKNKRISELLYGAAYAASFNGVVLGGMPTAYSTERIGRLDPRC